MTLRRFLSIGVLLVTLDCCYAQTWNNWEPWASCTATCGTGTSSRVRTCGGPHACTGHTQEHETCHNANDCMWAAWGAFGSCSVSCGTGVLTRFRECANGNITSNACVGADNSTTPCTVQPCPHWNDWSDWSACPVTCSEGVITRARTCNGTGTCVGNSTETATCSPTPSVCPGEWGQWAPLPCSKTCGAGTQIRTRTCGPPGGCSGPTQDAILCNERTCSEETDGAWGEWTEWGACSKTCGRGGRRSRTRMCQGSNCSGDDVESAKCPKQGRCKKRCRRRGCKKRRRGRN